MELGLMILGWLGVLIYLIVIFTANKLLENGESALLHLLICFAFILMTPIPLFLSITNSNQIFILSSVFGYLFLIMIITTMALQVGHLSYSNKQQDKELWEDRDNWMIHGMLGDVYESIVNVVFHIWIMLLAIGFFLEEKFLMGILMTIFTLFIVRSLGILLNEVIQKPIPFLRVFRMNPVITTLETLLFFITILCWITF
ncbi:hypothetical protein [Pontibacillus marinus]|uniref:Uncharacterized protein n=1 Tax=Pontibacillus marinus BH030004 = DSM 16465 TaxID=1385511 RepID=A0A0A5GAC7_9BACI|nr:hypothetical protein [Pontibacillus marinus]KGX90121.1 hypothetical protein N783_01125 [Pontibacillus marinus BH030004 = DSM 16465]